MATKQLTKACETCGTRFHYPSWRPLAQYCSKRCARKGGHGSLRERIYAQIVYLPDAPGCWLWTGLLTPHGYGRSSHDSRHVMVHRQVYEWERGPVPRHLDLCHRCDTPCCVNPEHMFIGTRAENMQDAAAKGHTTKGITNANAKLCDADILAIRLDARTQQAIATDYGVSNSLIGLIKRRRIWTHI